MESDLLNDIKMFGGGIVDNLKAPIGVQLIIIFIILLLVVWMIFKMDEWPDSARKIISGLSILLIVVAGGISAYEFYKLGKSS